MNCLECRELLQRRLDGESLPNSPELEQHLAGCQACRQDHQGVPIMLDGLRNLPRPASPAQFTRQIAAAVVQDRLVRQRRLRVRFWVTVSMAASILIMAWAGYLWLPDHRPDNQGAKPLVVEKGNKPAPEEPVAPLAQSMDEASQAVVALTDRFTDQTKKQAQMLIAAAPKEVPMGPWWEMPPLEEPLDPAAQSLKQAGQGFSEGFTTVARNARRAMDYFVKEMPSLEVGVAN